MKSKAKMSCRFSLENSAVDCAVCGEWAEYGVCPACVRLFLRDEAFVEEFLQGRRRQCRGYISLADFTFCGETHAEYLSAHGPELAVYIFYALKAEKKPEEAPGFSSEIL